MTSRRSVAHPGRWARRTVAAGVVVTALIAAGCSTSDKDGAAGAAGSEATTQATGEVDLFDASVVHAISVTYDQADYDAMIETFATDGSKEWIHGDVTVDGSTYEDVGLRLKGNSSLMGLGSTVASDEPATTTTAPDTTTAEGSATEDDGAAAGPPGGGPGGFGGGVGSASADKPEELPWLIDLNKFVKGQDHQGYKEFVVRANNTETSLNEAVALDLLNEVGLASQEAIASSFSVNDDEPVLRLVIENPDGVWLEDEFGSDGGVLYKAESTGDYTYRGDDPTAYEEVFDLEAGDDTVGVEPLVEFLDFINNSDDATFAAELDQHLDVEAFADYLAMMEILGNFDDIDGPGNNSYLYFDADGRATVVAWDLNLAFGVSGVGGGGQGPGGFQPPEGMELPEGMEIPEGAEIPEDFQPPEGMEIPEGFEPPDGATAPDANGGAGAGGRGFMGGSNILVERFKAVPEFEQMYQDALVRLEEELIDSGVADEVLDTRADVLRSGASDLVEESVIDEESTQIREQLTS